MMGFMKHEPVHDLEFHVPYAIVDGIKTWSGSEIPGLDRPERTLCPLQPHLKPCRFGTREPIALLTCRRPSPQ